MAKLKVFRLRNYITLELKDMVMEELGLGLEERALYTIVESDYIVVETEAEDGARTMYANEA